MGVKVGFQAEPGGETASQPRVVVPQRAMRRSGNATVVFVLREDRVERRAVSVGGSTGDGIEVLSGLRPGESVVLDPPADLGDGSRVRLRAGEGET